MKRLAGIILSGVLLLLGALFQLLMAILMALAGAFLHRQIASGRLPNAPASPPMPGWMPIFIFALCAVFVALAAWEIVTAIGLFRVRRWARYSVLVIGGALALFGLVSLLVTLTLLIAPLPGGAAAGMDPSQVHSMHVMARAVFGAIALFYAFLCAVGLSWLVYFNLKKVRDIFAGLPGQAPESPRPFLISLLAVLSLIGAAGCLLFMFVPLPGLFFGLILHGWGKVALYLVSAALLAAAGIGLWRLLEWGRMLVLALQVVGLVQHVVYLVRPSLYLRYTEEVNRIINPMQQPPSPLQIQSLLHTVSFGIGILFYIAIIAVLHYYRGAFARPAEPPQIESAVS